MLIFIIVKFSLDTFSVSSDWLKIEWQFFSVNEVRRRLLIILVLSGTPILLSHQQQQEDIFSVNTVSRDKQTCSNKRKLRIFHTFSSPTEKRQPSHLFEWSQSVITAGMPIEGATQEPQRVISAMQRQPVRACFGWIPTWKHIPGALLCDMNTSLWWNTSHPTGTALKVICPYSAGVFPLSNNRKSASGSHREWGWSCLGESGGRNTPTFLLNNCNPLTFTCRFFHFVIKYAVKVKAEAANFLVWEIGKRLWFT